MKKPIEYINGVDRYEISDIKDILLSKGEGYRQYLDRFAKASAGVLFDYPMYLVLEVNNYCNMRCKMCIRQMDESRNSHHNMDMGIFERIIESVEQMGIPSVFLGGGAECLINPKIIEMINKIRGTKRNVTDDVLITNGYELTDDLINLLIDLQWEKLFISIDAARDETYRVIRGRSLNIVEDRVKRVVELKEQHNSRFPILRVSFVVMNENIREQMAFFEKWKDKVDIIDFQELVVYSSEMRINKEAPVPQEVCYSPFNRLMINSYGDIFPCCVEFQKYYKLGNVADITIADAWKGERIHKLRKTIMTGKYSDVCRTCLQRDI